MRCTRSGNWQTKRMGGHKLKKIDQLCGLICLIAAIITADIHWVIAGAIFKVAANIKEASEQMGKNDHGGQDNG